MAEHEVEWVQLSGGHVLPAHKMVCPVCHTMSMGTTVNTESTPWRAHCPCGQDWRVDHEADA